MKRSLSILALTTLLAVGFYIGASSVGKIIPQNDDPFDTKENTASAITPTQERKTDTLTSIYFAGDIMLARNI